MVKNGKKKKKKKTQKQKNKPTKNKSVTLLVNQLDLFPKMLARPMALHFAK